MNDITQQYLVRTPEAVDHASSMTRQLEQLWLLSALNVGLQQTARGDVVMADKVFFDTMRQKLFGHDDEQVIKA